MTVDQTSGVVLFLNLSLSSLNYPGCLLGHPFILALLNTSRILWHLAIFVRYPVLLIRKCDMSSPINFSYGYKFWPYYFPSKACRRSEKTTFCPFISSSLKIWFTKFRGNWCRETNLKIVFFLEDTPTRTLVYIWYFF